MSDIYCELSQVYRDLSLEDFSIGFGKAVLSYFFRNGISVRSGLDLCCGTGGLCRLFAENGIRMTGIDLSREMIGIAEKEVPGCCFLCGDVLKTVLPGPYDLVTCVDDSINHFTKKEDLQLLFEKAYDLLSEGGHLVFDMINPEAVTIGEPYRITGKNGMTGTYLLTETGNGLLDIGLTAFRDEKELFSVHSEERIYDRSGIWEMLLDSGFTMPVCATEFCGENTAIKIKIVAEKI